MRSFILILFMLSTCTGISGQEYAVSKIPPSLLPGAVAIKRFEEIRYEMTDLKEMTMHSKFAITVLNENGLPHSQLVEFYDEFKALTNIEGKLYDASGNLVKKLKNKQVMDFSGTSTNDLADDDRVKVHQFHYNVYPYTVEYEVDARIHQTMFLPFWTPCEAPGMAVEKSEFSFSFPSSYKLRYRSFNYNNPPESTEQKNKTILIWKVKGLSSKREEIASSSWWESQPAVITGPSDFFIEGFKGNMSSWEDFGKFVYELKKNKDQLPPSWKTKVHQLTDGLTDTRTKIEILYNYFQQNTRYISVQLGIGGWQPFDATFVAEKGYGDCKALTNFMYSLLKEAGIASNYSLVIAGKNARPLIDFPSQQFNHVILMVPLGKDTMWLECTSQTLPVGYLSSFTNGRPALAITASGGVLVQTPTYTYRQNFINSLATGILDEQGDLLLKRNTIYSGECQDPYHSLIYTYNHEKLKQHLPDLLDFDQPDITSFLYQEKEGSVPSISEELLISIKNYGNKTGKRIFFIPCLVKKWNLKPSRDSVRENEIVLKDEFQESDSSIINFPAGYKVEILPKDIHLKMPFGEYHYTFFLQQNQLICRRSLLQYSGKWPASAYNDLCSFYETIYHSDRSKVVLVKAE